MVGTETDNLPDGFTEVGYKVYERSYQREKPDGTRETWAETVDRVVSGNIGLSPIPVPKHEVEDLVEHILSHKIVPAGRQLYMSGVPGRQFLFNCHVSGWGEYLADHFTFTFMRLMEGGGVGANYSHKHVGNYTADNLVRVWITCDEGHPDYVELEPYISKDLPFGARRWKLEDSREGWAFALERAIAASKRIFPCSWVDKDPNGDVVHLVFDLSDIRCKGSEIKSFGGTAAGPAPLAKLLKQTEELMNAMWLDGVQACYLMQLDHAISECVIAGNVRRSARMSIMHWDDPDIDWFIQCKSKSADHWSTNISVEIDNEFIELINIDRDFDAPIDYAVDPGFMAKLHRAHNVYDSMCEGMLKNGEPGFWNSSLANVGENGKVIATNPCGEIGLEPWENCNLGHVNLAKFVLPTGEIDEDGLAKAHYLTTRFLMRATYGDVTDDAQREIVDRNRRIGVGHLGYHNFVTSAGIEYSESHRSERLRNLLSYLKDVVETTSLRYAKELRIPAPIKVTAVAPTGTISKMSGVASGIQPIIAKHFILRIRYSSIDPEQVKALEEFKAKGYNVVKDLYSANTMVVEIPSYDPILDTALDQSLVESAGEISLDDMLSVQAMYQRYYADNSVSYTINIDEGSVSADQLGTVLMKYLDVLKGTTIMVNSSRPQAPYEEISREDYLELIEFLDVTQDTVDLGCSNGACPVR